MTHTDTKKIILRKLKTEFGNHKHNLQIHFIWEDGKYETYHATCSQCSSEFFLKHNKEENKVFVKDDIRGYDLKEIARCSFEKSMKEIIL